MELASVGVHDQLTLSTCWLCSDAFPYKLLSFAEFGSFVFRARRSVELHHPEITRGRRFGPFVDQGHLKDEPAVDEAYGGDVTCTSTVPNRPSKPLSDRT